MKRITLIAAVLLIAASATFALDRYTTAESLIRIEGTSTLHDWKMEGTMIRGAVQLTDPQTKSADVAVTIPVTSIRSEHDRMDKLMAEALKAKAHPEIRYEMTGSRLLDGATDEKFTISTTGKLTIAGMTRDVAMDVTALRNSDRQYALTGAIPIRMSDYGIKPPKAMMGTIRTGDDVKVSFRWVVNAN